MFGFFHARQSQISPLGLPLPVSLPAGTLVSKEDIYRENKGMAPILLLRKGFEVSMDELPRFIRNGARPHQFFFKPSNSPDIADIEVPEALPQQLKALRRQGMMEEFGVVSPYRSLQRDPRDRQRVLILEPDQKSLKRLIDCLFICGTPLDKIHTVRLPQQLAWAIAKYKPQILMVDYALSDQQTGLALLASLQSLPGVEKIIFTIDSDSPLSEAEQQTLEALGPAAKVKLLPKPVSRFTVNRILAD